MADARFLIKGGKKLSGTIEVKGAKNAALKLFAAALLTDKTVTITNVPEVEDIIRTGELLVELGCVVEHPAPGTYLITAKNIATSLINPDVSKQLRASIVLTGPLLARTGKVQFPHPGGCVIGARPIDVFLDGYKAMGASIERRDEMYDIRASRLKGCRVFFNTVSVTGTETLMMAATLAEGATKLVNCACEPEISALADFLNSCGAKISGAGTPEITITGVKELSGGAHTVIPDRIEAGSFAVLAAATGSSLTITNCEPAHLESLWHTLQKIGVSVAFLDDKTVRIIPSLTLRAVDLKTHEYPGLPTDLQAPLCVLLTQADGPALVHETIYEGRLYWTEDLKRMGANVIQFDPHRIQVQGPSELKGRDIQSPDLRAGMAFIIAALCASGETTIENVYQIDRGYEKIEERLQKIGADIKRI
jgi:UDP-N-acetylglucosamine 1-carboxyvinyltransferase